MRRTIPAPIAHQIERIWRRTQHSIDAYRQQPVVTTPRCETCGRKSRRDPCAVCRDERKAAA